MVEKIKTIDSLDNQFDDTLMQESNEAKRSQINRHG